ncbi:MAG TPA: acetoacetate decarboxylase family protein [Kofleriaceae bacterium]|nr:acetoacetate decarboxylase family protein [Kofleriaceae bacterium]
MNVDRFPPRLFKHLKLPVSMIARAFRRRVEATVHYRDMSVYGGAFDAPTREVQARLPPGFTALERSAGVSEVRITALDYRDVDWLSPYREAAVTVPVRFRATGMDPIQGWYVLQLPVTTEEARWPGVENFGFPKFVAHIQIEGEDGTQHCTVDHAGQHVLTMHVRARETSETELRDRFLTVRADGMVVASTFDSDGELSIDPMPGGVTLELGNHAIADQLRELDVRLATGRALYGPRRHGVLSTGTDIASLDSVTGTNGRRQQAFAEILETRT